MLKEHGSLSVVTSDFITQILRKSFTAKILSVGGFKSLIQIKILCDITLAKIKFT